MTFQSNAERVTDAGRSASPAPKDWLAPELRFAISALILMGVLYAAYYYPHAPGSVLGQAIEGYLRGLALAAGTLIALFETGIVVDGTLISGAFPLRIVKSCSALDAQALYAATLLAFPARPRLKAWGLVAGVGFLTLLNLTRIAGLYFVGRHFPGSFDAIHEEIFPLLLVACAVAAFACWARMARTDLARGVT